MPLVGQGVCNDTSTTNEAWRLPSS